MAPSTAFSLLSVSGARKAAMFTVQGAQTEVVAIIRQLQQQGTVTTSRGWGDEYVV